MIVSGAAGHAKEVLQILSDNGIKVDYLFDNVSETIPSYFDTYKVIRGLEDDRIKAGDKFVLGLGGTNSRKILYDKFVGLGLIPFNLISNTAVVNKNSKYFGKGLNIMHFVFIAENAEIGDGSLINAYASLHHDVCIGEFTEIAPKALLLGGVSVGDFTTIGAGATILPSIHIGNNCVIGAGSVVTKDIGDNEVCYGIPAKVVRRNP